MARWIEGRVVENVHWTDSLYTLRIAADIAPFKAGQFGRLALPVDDRPLGRPYSFVNPPQDEVLEFYSIVVQGGPISARLQRLQPGEKLLVGPKGAGFFTLDLVADAEQLWMLSTGTALGPFLSMLRTDEPWRRFRQLVLVHAVRRAQELTYRRVIDDIAAQHPASFQYAPFISREDSDFALGGRVPAAITSGALEARTGLALSPDHAQLMVCGNPDMVRDTSAALAQRGFAPNTRKQRGQITTENYW
ncbi:MAG: ferredoxin--NADP reductase [Salinisphaera sp.]|nr:ferredoxin--NADP reductase [Salinisphaera sp.]